MCGKLFHVNIPHFKLFRTYHFPISHFLTSIGSTRRAYFTMDLSIYQKPVLFDRSPGSMDTSEDGGAHGLPQLEPLDRAAEKRLVHKCDLYVVPVLSLLYSLAFVDRINIGNARLQGLEKDLKMKGQDYNVALFIFFIPYILFEVPSNLIIRKIAPSTWLSSLMVLWGMNSLSLDHFAKLILEYRYRDCVHGSHKVLRWSGCVQILSRTV